MSMQRWAKSGMSNGGRIVSRGDPLTDDQLRAAVPSIFAMEAHESRSDRFAAIPTVQVLHGLRNEGFQPFSAQQALTRTEGRQAFTKHMLRLRHPSISNTRGEAFEIILVNANDGSSAYRMIPGFFRFVCANGLMVGERFEDVTVRHTGNAVDEVIEGAYRVLEDAPRVAAQVDQFRALHISDHERTALAEAAHILRFPDHTDTRRAPILAADLLRPRRADDRGTDLWAAFNVIQENTIRGGQSGIVREANGHTRRQRVREVAGIDQNRALNRALWTLTERLAELRAA